jgi:glycosyltransferase involved in cell wall biosynthesis
LTTPLRILHCLRAPIGGLFRHVHDLAKAQAELGCEVGVVCDAKTGGEAAERALVGLAESCSLGVTRLPMSRQPGLGDWLAMRQVRRIAAERNASILHGHGAKGGAYARLAGEGLKRKGRDVSVVYTPHGGSLHYSPARLSGRVYIAAERKLAPLTDGLLFESEFAARTYAALIGPPPCPAETVPNGLYPYEFYEAEVDVDAAEFVFIGELRAMKGVDVLLKALAALQGQLGREQTVRAVIVGGGPDEATFKRLAKRLKLGRRVVFAGPLAARIGFARGQCVVVPSRAESFPYVVLEAAAAQMPLIATHVGGIPEITAGVPMPLIPPGDMPALAEQMRAFVAHPGPFLQRAAALQSLVAQRFTVTGMAEQIVGFYEAIHEPVSEHAATLR